MKIIELVENWIEDNRILFNDLEDPRSSGYAAVGLRNFARHLDSKYELVEKPKAITGGLNNHSANWCRENGSPCNFHRQPEVEKDNFTCETRLAMLGEYGELVGGPASWTLKNHTFENEGNLRKCTKCSLILEPREPEVGKKELCPKGCFQCDSPKGVITAWSFPCEKGGHCHHNSCDVRHEKPCDEPNCVQSKYRHRKDLSDLELREMKLQPQPSKVENKELQIAPDVTATIKGHEFTHSCCQPSKCEHEWMMGQTICKKCYSWNPLCKPSSELPEIEELPVATMRTPLEGDMYDKINELVRGYNALRALNK